MQEDALVSVIVPCYNYAHYLGETLESLLEQTYQNWECLIIDDGSIDNTKEVAMLYVNKDQRFRYIYQNNKGLPGARNTGMLQAKGSFYQYLDADDLLQKDKFKVQVAFLQANPQVDIVYSNVLFFTDAEKSKLLSNYPGLEGTIHMPRVVGQGPAIVNEFLRSNIKVNTPLLRKEIVTRIGLMDEALVISSEDWKFWLTAAINNLYFHYYDHIDTCALVRAHEQSVSMPGSEKLAKTRASTQSMFDGLYREYASIEYLKKTPANMVSAIFGRKALDELSTSEIKKGLRSLMIVLKWGNDKGYYLKHGIYFIKELIKKRLV